ncbi:MAG: GNAT family N-acetyltransferase [Oscillospiraceae bacterium]
MEFEFKKVVSDEEILAVERLADVIWVEHYQGIIPDGQAKYMTEKFQSKKAIAEQISEGTEYFLVEVSGKAAGYFAYAFKENFLYLSKIYVHSDFRKNGIASGIFAELEKISSKKGVGEIRLNVNKYNKLAMLAYEKNGFKVLFSEVSDIGGGFVCDDFVMSKLV